MNKDLVIKQLETDGLLLQPFFRLLLHEDPKNGWEAD